MEIERYYLEMVIDHIIIYKEVNGLVLIIKDLGE